MLAVQCLWQLGLQVTCDGGQVQAAVGGAGHWRVGGAGLRGGGGQIIIGIHCLLSH